MFWRQHLRVPHDCLSPQSIDLIHKLLTDDRQRLGSNGAAEIKQHPFFANVKFDGLRQTKAPLIPQIRYPTDTSHFDCVDENKRHSVETRRDATLENGYPDHAFLEFTFKRFFDEGGHPMAMKIPNSSGDDDSAVYV